MIYYLADTMSPIKTILLCLVTPAFLYSVYLLGVIFEKLANWLAKR